MKKESYKSLAKTISIKANSRCSICIKNNYYTVEYSEERIIPEIEGVNLEEERKLLWDTCNAECDSQIEDILKTFKK